MSREVTVTGGPSSLRQVILVGPHELFADDPVYPELEVAKLADSLTFFAKQLGHETATQSAPQYATVQRVLQAKPPEQRAAELVNGGTATAGMIAKLRACEHALAGGVDDVLIVDGRNAAALVSAADGAAPASATRVMKEAVTR